MRTKQAANRKQKEREAEERHQQELAARASKKRRSKALSSSTPSNVPRRLSNEGWSKKRRERLELKSFGNNSYLDWKVLRAYGLEEIIRQLINVGPWAQFFEIVKPTYRELTLEFLSTIKMDT